MYITKLQNLIITAAIFTAGAANAGNFHKADNNAALNVASAWTNNSVPGAGDVAVWDSNVSALNTTNSLGVNTVWSGIQVLNPGGPVQINSGFNLTNGAAGVNLSQAVKNLTLSNNIILGAPQYWRVGSGATLSLGGNLARTAGSVVRFQLADGTANVLLTNTPSTLLTNGAITYGTVNDIDFAGVNGSQQVVGGSTLGLYLSNPSGATPNISGTTINQVYDLNTSDSGSFGIRVSGNAVILGVRVNQPNANGIPWQLNTTTKTLTLNSILVTTNAGNLPVEVNGTGNLRIGSTGNQELLLYQNNPAASLIFQAGLVAINQQGTGSLTKLGVGTVEIQSPSTYTGGSRIYEGTLLIDGGGNLGTGPLTVYGGSFATAAGATNFAPTTILSGANQAVVVTPANRQFVQATNLWLGSGAAVNFILTNGAALSTTSAPLVITNANTGLFTTNTVSLNLIASLPVGQYPLIKYGTLGGAGFGAFQLGNIEPHVSAFLSNNIVSNSIDLVVTANNDPLKWAAASGVWDIGTTADWQTATGASATYQQAGTIGDAVLLEDTVSGASPIIITLNTNPTPLSVTVNATKNYTITGTGGIGGPGSLVKSGSGTLTLATANSFNGGLILSNGVTVFSALTNLGGGGISFAGGTLKYSPGNTADISTLATGFNAGGTTIDDGGNAIAFANPVGNGGVGGLTKVGSGTITLNGTNTYSGNTTVGTGTLALGALASISNGAAIVVNSGATFDVSADSPLSLQNQILAGTGTIKGGVNLAAGATLSPATNGVVGTLTINSGDLTVSGGTLALDVSSASRDSVVVSGNLNLNSGTLQLIVSGTLANGTYKLIQYGGSLGGSAANLAITGFSQSGHSASLSSATSGEIDLVIANAGGASLVWQGDGGNNFWDVGSSADWLNGSSSSVFANADLATFNNNSPNQTVNLLTAVQPGAVTVNSTLNYTFQDGSGTGAGKISGTTGVSKSGSGTLTVLTTDNNSGPTVINAGAVQVGNGNATGDLGTGNITNNGTLIYQQPDGRSVAGQISGTGTLTQRGGGVLSLTGNNTFSGGTLISSGTLQVGAGGGTGSLGTGAVTNNSVLVLNRSSAYAAGNVISGSGSLVNIGSGTVTLGAANSYQGGTTISNGVVKLGITEAIPGTGLFYTDGTLDLNGFNESVSALNGNAGVVTNSGVSGTNIFSVGDDADASTFNGVITENVTGAKIALVKQGAGTLQLNGANNYSGGTLVANGQLNIGPSALPGTGNITLTNGTTLNLASAGSAHVTLGNNIVIATNSTATLASANAANIFNGNLIGDVTTSNLIGSSITFGQLSTKQLESFFGTLVISSIGTVRFSSSGAVTINGGDNFTLDLEGFLLTKSGGTLAFGALEGGGTINPPGAGTQTLIIGANGANSTFSGTISSGNSLVKTGPGTLTLNGGLGQDGSTTVSNGVLALASDGTALDTSPTIILAAATAVIDVSGRSDDSLNIGNSQAQTLSGLGTIRGKLTQAAGSTINVGPGVLNVTNSVTLSGAVNVLLNRTNAVNAGEISTPTLVVNPGATLTITNVGPAFQGGEVFHLFNQPVSGFASVTLPVLPSPLAWVNSLTLNGTLAITGSLVNTNVTAITNTFDGNNLTLTWPSDHIGWHLQAQTNGLGTNWVEVAGGVTTNQFVIPVNHANGTVFFRLVSP